MTRPEATGRRGHPLTVLAAVAAAVCVVAVSAPGIAGAHAGHRARVAEHVPTWAYDDGCNGGRGAPARLVAKWVTYAESNCGPHATKALHDCHYRGRTRCTAVQYIDTNWIYPRGASVPILGDAAEGWWLHTPGHADRAHRIYSPNYGGGYLLNQANAAVGRWFHRYVRDRYDRYPALMTDDVSTSLAGQLYASGNDESRELASDRALLASHRRLARQLTHAGGRPFEQIANGITANPHLPMPLRLLGHPPAVRGLIAEGLPVSNGVLTGFYSTLLDELAYVAHTRHGFIVLLSYDPAGSVRSRLLQAATALLGYAGDHVVSWSKLEQRRRRLAIWPEQGIVPTRARQTMRRPSGRGCLAGRGEICSKGGHNDLEVAPGIFRREFGRCYERGRGFGRCAAVVNDTARPVAIRRAWLDRRYRHQVELIGGNVQSGGRVALRGARFRAGSTKVGAESAVILTR